MAPSVEFHGNRMNNARTLHEPMVTLPRFGRTVDENDVQIPKKDSRFGEQKALLAA